MATGETVIQHSPAKRTTEEDVTPLNKSCERSLSKSPSPSIRVLERYVDFGKHSKRKPLFLNSEQVELLEERKHNEEERMQKAQRYNEVLRNNVAEQVLGLPREAAPDRELPFNQVPHN